MNSTPRFSKSVGVICALFCISWITSALAAKHVPMMWGSEMPIMTFCLCWMMVMFIMTQFWRACAPTPDNMKRHLIDETVFNTPFIAMFGIGAFNCIGFWERFKTVEPLIYSNRIIAIGLMLIAIFGISAHCLRRLSAVQRLYIWCYGMQVVGIVKQPEGETD